MEKNVSCFVIIGYGKKTSYANGKPRILDLEETYSLLIKPVFDSLNIPCYRAIDKNLSGNIDKVMLQEIKNADIALVDISTLNANVMWELGVRHALKPHHTIMICEKEQMSSIPFDVNHFVVHSYTHSEEGIPYKEVDRFKNQLIKIVKDILNQDPDMTDSPVYTYLENELGTSVTEKKVKSINIEPNSFDSFVQIMDNAEKAKNNLEYEKALELLSTAKFFASQNMALKDNLSFIISRQALCTYKFKKPNELEALENAKKILDELNPFQSQDMEVLGLSGSIYKRLYELSGRNEYLDDAIHFYENGFLLKRDYYNGINAAYMLYKKASTLKVQNKEWEDIKSKGDYIRNSVLDIASKLELESDFEKKNDAIWILLTIAEVFNYKNNTAKILEYEEKAKAISEKTNDAFALRTYMEQKQKIGLLQI